MQQLDAMDVAGQKIGVKMAPLTAQETAQLAAAASRVDLDDEGVLAHLSTADQSTQTIYFD